MPNFRKLKMSVENKIDSLIEKQSAMNLTIARMEVDLAHHIKRSDKHEKQIDKLWYLLIAICAGGASKFGPELLKHIIGV